MPGVAGEFGFDYSAHKSNDFGEVADPSQKPTPALTHISQTETESRNGEGYRRCYYFRHADLFRRAAVIDGAVAAFTDGKSISAKFCLNSLPPRYEALRNSPVVRQFGTAVEDPVAFEADGALIADTDLDRKQEGPLLAYVQKKYKTGPLMKFDLGYTNAALLLPADDPTVDSATER